MKKLHSKSFRPRIEALEGRLVPATIMVTTTADVVNPHDGLLSLREAISLANATAAPDTIVLKAGVYKITLPGAGENANATGDFDITNPLTIVGQGANATAIDGGQLDRVFDVIGTFNAAFTGVTIRNGAGQLNGGAIQALSANLTLNNCSVSGNLASKGGGINAETGNVTLNSSTMTNNNADGNGGGIFAGQGIVTLNRSTLRGNQGANGGGVFAQSGKVMVTNSVLTNNRAFDDKGGAIYASSGDITATDSTFTANTAINGGALDDESGNVVLVRDTVDRNRATENGGGIRVPVGALTLSASRVRLNVAGQPVDGASGGLGGGVFAAAANVISSTVSGNTAFTAGGGVFTTSTAILTNSTVSGNQARLLGGGGILAPTASVFNSTISNNTAAGGVGGGINAATLNLTNSTVSGNTTSAGAGGGIGAATLTATGSTVSGNTAAGSGGGISAAAVNLTNCTVSGNSTTAAIGGGGGIFAMRGTILNSTIVENFSAADGGGILWAGGADQIHVKNTIIADNLVLTIPEVGQDVSGQFVSDGHNLIGVVNGSTGFGAAGDQLGSVGDPLDPRLGPLQNNGGPTQTHALLAGSPAIDHGDNSGAPATDQRGVARPRDGDGNGSKIVDIGAFEK
jgi:predicted outer membrane repeat protein